LTWSLAQIADAAAPHLDRRLAAPRELAAVRSLLASLPADLSDWLYFELRLSPRDPRIDVIARVDRAHRHALAGGRWPRAAAFAQSWADPRVAWSDAVESLWLEFDLDGAAGDEPALTPPRFFVDFAAIRNERPPEEWQRLVRHVIAPLAPQPCPGAITEPMTRVLTALPPGVSLLSVGLPSAGAAPGLRLCLAGLERRALPALLGVIGRAGHARGVSAVLDALLDPRSSRSRIDIVDLDLTPDGPGRLACELAFARRPQLRGALAEQALLERLVAIGLADGASIDALGAWPGCEIARLPHVFWPALLVRRLNHVKLVFEGDRVAAVKAYPCLFHRFSRQIAARLYSIDGEIHYGRAGRLPLDGTRVLPRA
jgi:hypothetical protein